MFVCMCLRQCQLVERSWDSDTHEQSSSSSGSAQDRWAATLTAHWLQTDDNNDSYEEDEESSFDVCNLHSMRLICRFLWNLKKMMMFSALSAVVCIAWSALWPWRVNKLVSFFLLLILSRFCGWWTEQRLGRRFNWPLLGNAFQDAKFSSLTNSNLFSCEKNILIGRRLRS